jgi:hypothetical protein
VNGPFSLDNPALPLRIGAKVHCGHVNVFNNSTVFGGENPKNNSSLARIFPTQD